MRMRRRGLFFIFTTIAVLLVLANICCYCYCYTTLTVPSSSSQHTPPPPNSTNTQQLQQQQHKQAPRSTNKPHALSHNTQSNINPSTHYDNDFPAATAAYNPTIVTDTPDNFVDVAQLAIPITWSSTAIHLLIDLYLGTPAQAYTVILDSGSAELFLSNASTPACDTRIAPCVNTTETSSSFHPVTPGGPITINTPPPRLNLVVDGELIGADAIIAAENVHLNAHIIGAAGQLRSPLAATQMRFLLGTSLTIVAAADALHVWNENSGLLGIAYNDAFLCQVCRDTASNNNSTQQQNQCVCSFAGMLETQAAAGSSPPRTVVALDVKHLGQAPSRMLIGGVDEQTRDSIVWAQPATGAVAGLYHAFQMFDLTVCGANIFANLSLTQGLTSIVDTGAACLELPAEVFDRVREQVPLECFPEPLPTEPNGIACYVPSRLDVAKSFQTSLPVLSFRVTQGGTWLHLRIADLVLPDYTNTPPRRRVCIRRGSSLQDRGIFFASFGSRTLLSLYTVLDMPRLRVGFATQYADGEDEAALLSGARDATCGARALCEGSQRVYSDLNLCLQPECDQYFFMEVDVRTQECRLTDTFYTVAVLCVTFFAVVEMIIHEVHQYLQNKVFKEVDPL